MSNEESVREMFSFGWVKAFVGQVQHAGTHGQVMVDLGCKVPSRRTDSTQGKAEARAPRAPACHLCKKWYLMKSEIDHKSSGISLNGLLEVDKIPVLTWPPLGVIEILPEEFEADG